MTEAAPTASTETGGPVEPAAVADMVATAPDGSGILVAVDGSKSANRALLWAAREAVLRTVPLRLAHVYTWPISGYPGPIPASMFTALQEDSVQILAAAAALVRDAEPALDPATVSRGGVVLPVLLQLAQESELTVVGSRGLGGFSGLLLGSVGTGLAARAACPVVVVRGAEPAADAPVVVGVDGSEFGDLALAAAFRAAELHHAPLLAVHCWQDPLGDAFAGREDERPDFDRASWESVAATMLAERLVDWRSRFPDVQVESAVDWRRPTKALLQHSTGARLLVVGSRGRGDFVGLLLGSTSRSMIQHADCPVMVVRP